MKSILCRFYNFDILLKYETKSYKNAEQSKGFQSYNVVIGHLTMPEGYQSFIAYTHV